jgi:hypothetical protein
VTLDDIKKVANRYFDARRSVTGTLVPVGTDGVANKPGAPAPLGRS